MHHQHFDTIVGETRGPTRGRPAPADPPGNDSGRCAVSTVLRAEQALIAARPLVTAAFISSMSMTLLADAVCWPMRSNACGMPALNGRRYAARPPMFLRPCHGLHEIGDDLLDFVGIQANTEQRSAHLVCDMCGETTDGRHLLGDDEIVAVIEEGDATQDEGQHRQDVDIGRRE